MKTTAESSKAEKESPKAAGRSHDHDVFFAGPDRVSEPFFKPASAQASMKIGQKNDPFEQEADQIAEKVVSANDTEVQMKSGDQPVVKKRTDGVGNGEHVPNDISGEITSNSGKGDSLPSDMQQEMETKIGADFSNVSIHTGHDAVRLSDKLGARAFTAGNDIYFNRGEYQPGTTEGRKLMAHELVHTVQQGGKKHQNGGAVVYGKWWEFWNWFSADDIEDMKEAIQVIDSHINEAQRVFDAAANTIGDNEIRNILNRAKNNLDSITGILSNAESNIERFENVSGLARAIEALSKIDISKDPAAAAEEFDNLFKYAGAIGQEINNPILSAYAEFLQQLGELNFFSSLSRTMRRGFGGQGSGVRDEINREFERQGKGRVYE